VPRKTDHTALLLEKIVAGFDGTGARLTARYVFDAMDCTYTCNLPSAGQMCPKRYGNNLIYRDRLSSLAEGRF
jgi:hypothetical protein